MSRISELEKEVISLKEKIERHEISSAIRRGHVDWAIWEKLRTRTPSHGFFTIYDVMECVVEVVEDGTFTRKEVFEFFKSALAGRLVIANSTPTIRE